MFFKFDAQQTFSHHHELPKKFMYNVISLSIYLDERKTVKYWKKVALNVIGRMAFIYKKIVGVKSMARLQFISKVTFGIEREWMDEKKKQPFNVLIRGENVWFSKSARSQFARMLCLQQKN